MSTISFSFGAAVFGTVVEVNVASHPPDAHSALDDENTLGNVGFSSSLPHAAAVPVSRPTNATRVKVALRPRTTRSQT
jgi:hypothetical protein